MAADTAASVETIAKPSTEEKFSTLLNIAEITALFGVDHRIANTLLANVPSDLKVRGSKRRAWKLATLIPIFKAYWSPGELTPRQRRDDIEAMRSHSKWLLETAQLVRKEDFRREMAAVVKAVVDGFTTLRDVVEREAALSVDQGAAIDRVVNRVRSDIASLTAQ